MSYRKLKFGYCVVFLILSFQMASGQNYEEQRLNLDVQNYNFSIYLSDTSDMIYANAVVTLLLKKPVQTFTLDLTGKDDKGKGMEVKSVSINGTETSFTHHNDSLDINCNWIKSNSSTTVNIEYSGVPADGLIISKNKFGERTFFGDNWPNRAHNWIPCIDYPSDKATVEFTISAPDHYEVIANGDMVKETVTDHHYKLTIWKSDEPLPTKVMVIGVADFAIDTVENNLNIPVSTWVYPMNADKGFADYKISPEPLSFYINYIGPFPFSKLADVQSTTLFGGMENAGNIFYREDLVTGKQKQEGIIAHEIAHQWFGDCVTEGNWYHIWLSEGFATYFTDLYYEYKYGQDIFKSRMETERKAVIRYAARKLAPVIDTTITDYMDLLNRNSYEKGAWFLHMLRKELGDALFMESIQAYYKKYKYSNALTIDFQNIVDSLSGKDMTSFFEQWLYKAGHPVLNITWYQKKKNVLVNIEQLQKSTIFEFPLELELVSKDGSLKTEKMQMDKVLGTYSFPVEATIVNLIPDPDVWLLYEGKVTRGKF